MKTDVWMPIYVGEYLADTMHLSAAEHGAYMLLIMAYWRRKGPLQDDDQELATITKSSQSDWSAIRKRLAGFFRISDGVWRHKRIDAEILKSNSIAKSKSKAGKIGNQKRWGNKAKAGVENIAIAQESHSDDCANRKSIVAQSQNDPPSQSQSHSMRESSAVERPSWEEVKMHAERIGLAEWKARDWFDEMAGCGWLDFQHRPIVAWQPVLNRVRTKWEADGRPSQPPSRQAQQIAPGTNQSARPSTWELTKKIETIEAEIKEIKNRGWEDAMTWHAANETDRKRLVDLKKLRRELQQRINQ